MTTADTARTVGTEYENVRVAAIEFVCRAKHDGRGPDGEGPTITLRDGVWAYCVRGAGSADGHEWDRVPPTTIDALLIASHARQAEGETEL